MKVATWNVNSIRTRLEHITQWLKETAVDVLCLQETKVVDAQFPVEPFQTLGYQCYYAGQKSYNGVAILSKMPLERPQSGFLTVLADDTDPTWDEQKRVIAGQYQGITIVNVYVPNGSSIGSEKYNYKLGWFEVFKRYLVQQLTHSDRLILCGDFNIAPDDRDIYDSANKTDHIMASIAERQALQSILSLGLVDAFRQVNDQIDQFTWWDYRAASFRRNLGWRIDHHYVSEALQPAIAGCEIDRQPRTWVKPSDHTPVILELTV